VYKKKYNQKTIPKKAKNCAVTTKNVCTISNKKYEIQNGILITIKNAKEFNENSSIIKSRQNDSLAFTPEAFHCQYKMTSCNEQ
jgi:hypothetical protein